ncbi:MAG: PAS domain-containing protein, partial [Cyclobacteriaceae bacterium]|nr:PAS domain-containing protein [Cyclobacteriaceae bacterium]
MKHTPQEDNLNSTFDILVNAAALMADSPIAVLHLEEGQTSQLYTYNPGGIEWEPDTFTGYRSNDVFEIQTNTSVEKGTSLVNIFPFFTLEGTYLGYLCVMDPAKKELCADSRHKLDAIVLHVRELLESKWAKREMRRYQNLVENIGDMIFELDENGFFTYVNSSSVEITGYSKEELRQMRYQDVLDEPSIDELGKIIKDNLKNQNKTSYLECQILTKEKGKLDISLRMHFVFDGNWLVRAFAIGRDITELVKTQNQLLESEEKYRLISENFRDLIILHNIDGSYRYISSSVRDMLGYEADELIGYDPYRLIHPEDLVKIFDEPERKRLEGGIIKNTEFRIKDKKDIYHWFESYTKPIYDRKNKLIAFQSFSRDITIQKENQEKFQKTDADLNRYKEGLKLLNEITSNTELSSKKQIEQALWASTE